MTRLSPSLHVAVACFGMLLCTPTATEATVKRNCSQSTKRLDSVYVLGSSTIRNALGPILKQELQTQRITTWMWGKAASGLARPDYHDWPAAIPALIKKYRPKVFVVMLGTNDGQHMYHRGAWIRYQDPRWSKRYARRVDRMLKVLSGPKRDRIVVWIGPTALPYRRAAARMKRVRGILRDRISRFKGPAFFVDGLDQTLRKGKLIRTVTDPATKTTHRAREADNIHLTWQGVRWLLAEPVLRIIRRCTPPRVKLNAQ